ncbi:MAG: DUF3575 domain-containing protein [Rikenellaceae bacterium]
MKKVIGIITLLLLCMTSYGQAEQKSKEFKIYFEHKSHIIDVDFNGNRAVLNELSDFIAKLQQDSLTNISKIEVSSSTSPEGGRTLNDKLSESRSSSIYDYLTQSTSVPQNVIVLQSTGIDWQGLENLVAASDMQYKDEVLEILNNVPEETWSRVDPSDRWLTMTDSRNKHLMMLRGGRAYNYMFDAMYPELRQGTVATIYYERKPQPKPQPKPEPRPEPKPEPVVEQPAAPVIVSKPLFALKTNLLFDAATLINVEVEVPIGQRWSIAGEWIFPWWTTCGNSGNSWQKGGSTSSRNTLQVLNGNIEGKYWFGDRTNRPVMTGWHLGLYAGGGLYDLEYDAEGYQGEFFIAAGISGGYAHTINKSGNLRMEYSLGVGYMQTDYRYYKEHFGIDDTWHTMRQNNGEYTWIGPTRARVSLVWMLNRKVTKEE